MPLLSLHPSIHLSIWLSPFSTPISFVLQFLLDSHTLKHKCTFESIQQKKVSFEVGCSVLTLMIAYNHIGWICPFFLLHIYLVSENILSRITEAHSLDVAVTKIQFPAFFWLPARSGCVSRFTSYYQLKDTIFLAWEPFLLLSLLSAAAHGPH